eukprot:4569442-Alexandrium_andersonii.AAC.1
MASFRARHAVQSGGAFFRGNRSWYSETVGQGGSGFRLVSPPPAPPPLISPPPACPLQPFGPSVGRAGAAEPSCSSLEGSIGDSDGMPGPKGPLPKPPARDRDASAGSAGSRNSRSSRGSWGKGRGEGKRGSPAPVTPPKAKASVVAARRASGS